MANDDWREVSPDTLPADIKTAYDEAKAIYRQYKETKAKFEGLMQAEFAESMPAGQELKFGYNFGKLSVAVGPKREVKRDKAKQSGSLNDWLSGQRESGART